MHQISKLSLRPAVATASTDANNMIEHRTWQQLDGGLQLVINRYLKTVQIIYMLTFAHTKQHTFDFDGIQIQC
jgi:hypothetical protein